MTQCSHIKFSNCRFISSFNGLVFCLLTCNFCSNTDNIVYSGTVPDTTTLKVNDVPDNKPPVLWSNGYADSASLSDDYKAPIVLLPQLHSNSNGATPVSNMRPQEYETPVSALISSAQPSDFLTSNDRAHRAQLKRNETRHENHHVVNGSYAKLLHQYLLRRQTKQTDRDSPSQVNCLMLYAVVLVPVSYKLQSKFSSLSYNKCGVVRGLD